MPALAPIPPLHAHAKRILDSLRAGKSVSATGPSGSGRSTLLASLRSQPDVLLVELLAIHEMDCVAAATVEAMAALRSHTLRPRTGRRLDYHSAGHDIARTARSQGRILIVRVPASWCSAVDGAGWDNSRTTAEDASTEGCDDDRPWFRNSIAWLAGLLATDPVCVVSDNPLDAGAFGFYPQEHIALPQHRVGLHALARVGWGSYRGAYQRLGEATEDHLAASPVEWRLAVGLVALDQPVEAVREAIGRPVALPTLVQSLADSLEQLPHLRASVGGFLQVRRPMLASEVMQLFTPPLEHQPLMAECIAYETEGQVKIPSSVRGPLAFQLNLAEKDASLWHQKLATKYRELDGAPSWSGLSPDGARAWCEKAFFSTTADSQSWEELEFVFPEQYWQRGRFLSVTQHQFDEAADVYLRCTAAFPDDDYAWHYLGWNLQAASASPDAVELAYRRAIALNPSNSWWNSRLVTFLIQTGQFAAAREEWRHAVSRVDPDGDRLNAGPWLALHFYRWVADAWLRMERPGAAAEVLELLPNSLLARLPELASLRKRAVEAPSLVSDSSSPEAKDLLSQMYTLIARDREREATQLAFARFEDWISQDDQRKCGTLLRNADIGRLGICASLGVLTAVLPVRDLVADDYASFVARLRTELTAKRPTDAEALLDGLV